MTDKLREAVQQALSAPGCERLKDWYEIGPAQRAAVETFLEAALSQQDAQAELPIIRQNKLLADALASCILASGIVRTDIDGLTGPQLLLFAEDLREMLETKKAQQEAHAVQGWKLVPIEPTEVQIKEGNKSAWPYPCAPVYRAMLNAAPTPPQQRVTLTDEEIDHIEQSFDRGWHHIDLARAVIEAYEIKNGTNHG